MTINVQPIRLDHRVDLYIPSQCICGGMLPEKIRNQMIEEVKQKFDIWFGAHSEIPIMGDWPLPDGTRAVETVADIFSFCSSEALQEHHEDVDLLAVEIGNRLSQDHVLRVIDGLQVALWPNTITGLIPNNNCACRGGGRSARGLEAKPIEDIGKVDQRSKMLIIQGILRSFRSSEHARKLFCEALNYHYASGELPYITWPESIRALLANPPAILADHNGFKIVDLHLSSEGLRLGAQRQVIKRVYKDDPTFRGLFVVSNRAQDSWEVVNVKISGNDNKQLVLRRMRVGIDSVRTATERISSLEVAEKEEITKIQERHDKAFDVEAVTKAFFAEIANWYFWALKNVKFPKGAPKEEDNRDHVSVIRLITRLIFCWFIKEKQLIHEDLFDEQKLGKILFGFTPGKDTDKNSVYYKAILQNLFFATLNTEMDKRGWRRNGQNFMTQSLYRYKKLFSNPDKALDLFKNIPFLNGGLFECLDKDFGEGHEPRYSRIDGFSDREDSQAVVPDFLFFGGDREVDLSEQYDDKKFKKVKVRGLIHTLKHYRFTVEESTPLEEEVALDPELAGKIFENLLAAYNPETGATARKQTGSFYTHREIVGYMVDESLITHLKGKLEDIAPTASDVEPRLRNLFSYDQDGHLFTHGETDILITLIDQIKVLDPAVGSGAFPMGVLHKLVFILRRLDPRNEKWKERQKRRIKEMIAAAEERIQDGIGRNNVVQDLEKEIENIENAFERNTLDYGRKLYLIENCLYGVDIQPIAVQIAKMRFFISLIADQKVDPTMPNLGVIPLPNLETKLIAANTLIGIYKPEQLRMRNSQIDILEAELSRVRKRNFYSKTTSAKSKCQEQDKELRAKISDLLKNDGWNDKTAKQLSGWDPYDQNTSSGFLDLEWMFSMREGFDIVIGNPPFLESRHPSFNEDLKDLYQSSCKNRWGSDAKLITRGADLLIYFFETSLTQIKDKGLVVFITQNAWLDTEYGIEAQKFLTKHTNVFRVIDSKYRYFPVGEGPSINTVITLFMGNKVNPQNIIGFYILKDKINNISLTLNASDVNTENTQYRANYFSYSDPILKKYKWGILHKADSFVLELLQKLEKRAKSIDKIESRAQFTFGQGLNVPKSTHIPKEVLKINNIDLKLCYPILYSGAPFQISKSEWFLVKKDSIDKKTTDRLIANGYTLFEPRQKKPPVLIMPRGISRHYCCLNSIAAYSLSGVDIYSSIKNNIDKEVFNLWCFFNSTLFWFLREISGRKNLGGGLLKSEAIDLKFFPVYLPLDIKKEKFASLLRREAMETLDEIDTEDHNMIDEIIYMQLEISIKDRNRCKEYLRNEIVFRTSRSVT